MNMRPNPQAKENLPRKERVNEQIRLPEVQLIDAEGNNHGTISSDRAREMAREVGMDLVEINPSSRPPICKIMDYGKFKYQQSKKLHDSKKKQHQAKLKEIRLTPKTEEHDLQTKIRQIREFLEDGDKVQISIKFTGREIVHKELGEEQLKRLVDSVQDVGKPEGRVEMQGKRMVATLLPDRKAQQSKEAREKAAEARSKTGDAPAAPAAPAPAAPATPATPPAPAPAAPVSAAPAAVAAPAANPVPPKKP